MTAVVKSQTNRARSVAARMVSGAGFCQPVFQTPHSDESASIRTRPSLDPLSSAFRPGTGCRCSKAVATTGACQRVVPGTIAHTKEATGSTDPMRWRVGGSNSTCPPQGGTELGAQPSRHGDVTAELWVGPRLETTFRGQEANRILETRNGHAGIQRAPLRPDEKPARSANQRF